MSFYNYLKTNQLVIFLSVLVFFQTARLLVIGSGHATGIDLLFGLVPEILFALILACFLFSTLKDTNRKTHFLDKFVLIYFLFNVIVGFLLANDFVTSLYGFRLTYLPMLAYFVGSYYWDKKVDLERLFHGLFQILVLVAVIGFIIYFFLPDVHLYFHKLTTDKPVAMAFSKFVRMTSIFWTPVVFAMTMLSAFCYWTYYYFKTGNKWALVYLFIVLNALFLSISRGPIIAAFIGFGILLLLSKNRKLKLIVSGLLLLEFVVAYSFIPQISDVAEWIFQSSKQTVSLEAKNTRVGLWIEVMHTFKNNPMGLGLGKAGHAAVHLFPPNTPGVSFASTDGWYFKLMIETGVLALIMYLSMAFSFFIYMLRYVRKNAFDFVSFIFTVFVVTGFVNVVSNALDFYLFSYLYWVLLGLFVFKLKQNNNAKKESISSHS
jgi:hypothetical protein